MQNIMISFVLKLRWTMLLTNRLYSYLTISFLIIFTFSCDPEESKEIESVPLPEKEDTVSSTGYQGYKEVQPEGQRVRMMIPEDWDLEGMVLYDSTGKKIGEFAPGLLTPEKDISGREYLQRLENAGPDLQAQPVSYSFGEDYDYIYGDTLDLSDRTWYLGKTSSPFESATGAYGFWYPHHYFTKVNGSVFIITFYSREESFSEEERKKVLNVLRSLELTYTAQY